MLVPIDAALIPLVSGALLKFQARGVWATETDYQRGYNAFAELQANLMNSCLDDLVKSNERLYRLLDAALNGTAYSSQANPDDPANPLISPAIPDVPSNTVGAAPGLRRQLLDAQGIIDAGWFGIGGRAPTLADVLGALRVGNGNTAASIRGTLDTMLAGGGSAASIFNAVSNLFDTAVEGVADGAILGVLIASSMAQAAMMGAQAAQLDRLIASLDGGGLVRPSDNVLQALRGDTPASDARSVVGRLSFDPTAEKGVWDGSLGQMMFDALVLRYEGASGPQLGPLAYLVANQWGSPEDLPTAIYTLRQIYDLLNTPGADYSAALDDIKNYLYDATSGNGVATLVAQLIDLFTAYANTAGAADSAGALQLAAIIQTLTDLHDCICGADTPPPGPPDDPNVCAIDGNTEVWRLYDWIELPGTGGYYSAPVTVQVDKGLILAQGLNGAYGRLRVALSADVDYCWTWLGPDGEAGVAIPGGWYPGVFMSYPPGQPTSATWDALNPDNSPAYVEFYFQPPAGTVASDYVIYVHLKARAS